jgi:hypothetical protein
MSQNCPTNGPIVHPTGDDMSVESHGDEDDDGGWGKLLTHPAEFSGNPTSCHLGERRRNGQRSENFAYQYLKHLKGL